MSRVLWKILAAASAVALAASCAVGAMAYAATLTDQPTLVYDGAAKSFTYRNVKGSDLFSSFKGVMPGDELSQDFVIEGVNIAEPTSIYAQASYEESQTAGIEDVSIEARFGDGVEAEGTLGEENAMQDPVRIAVLSSDATIPGSVTMRVPTSLSNDTAYTSHELTWTFIAQEDGSVSGGEGSGGGAGDGSYGGNSSGYVSANSGTLAKTSDETSSVVAAALLCALVSFGVLLFSLRRMRA